MSVQSVRAVIICDGCGVEFSVGIDEAWTPPAGWSIWSIVRDAVRGGVEYKQKTPSRHLLSVTSSEQGGQLLCADCTYEADQEDAPAASDGARGGGRG